MTSPDQLLLSLSARRFVDSCRVPWRVARRLWLIPSGSPRNHVPVSVWFLLEWSPLDLLAQSRLGWNLDLPGECFQTGRYRTSPETLDLLRKLKTSKVSFLKKCCYRKCDQTEHDMKLFQCKGRSRNNKCNSLYCSIYCQKRDWNKTHRNFCK